MAIKQLLIHLLHQIKKSMSKWREGLGLGETEQVELGLGGK